MEERDFIEKVLQFAIDRHVDYADVRYIPISISENISVKNGVVENLEYAEQAGFGIRVLIDGCWGFASSFRIEEKEILRVLELAIKIAKASGITRNHPVKLSSALIWKSAKYTSPVKIDPFKVSLEEKVDLLVRADSAIRQESKKVSITEGDLSFNRVRKIFSSTEGSYITQEITVSGGGISAKAMEGNEVQIRSIFHLQTPRVKEKGRKCTEIQYVLLHPERKVRSEL